MASNNSKALFQKDPELQANSVTVLKKRYLRKKESGEMETPKDLFIRVAKNISQAELKFDPQADVDSVAEMFYNQMAALKFLPNSPTLMNAGNALQQLSACFVLPVEDSLEGIFEAVKYTALIHKSGGGTGFSFTRLRPKDDSVKTTKGVSSGPVSFMSVFDAATETIKQGGMRRGANMGILRVDHPDIMDFIYAKQDKTKLTNFNLSVGITEEFMKSVKKGTDYDLLTPRDRKKVGSKNAKEVFNEMVRLAWEGGDPGIIFLDRINNANPTPAEGEMESTNPCGEQPLLPYESCNLGSINLVQFVKNGKIDWDDLKNTCCIAVRFLDNVIEMNNYPIKQIDEMTKKNRKIGLGIMGWADMLVMLDIPYNSDKAIALAEEVMKFIRDEGRKMSVKLAETRGSFPGFDKSIYPALGFKAMRNATITTIAPTGTISIIAGASSGIEPYFALAYYRNVMDNNKLPEVNPYFLAKAHEGKFYSENLLNKLADAGNAHNLTEVPEDIRKIFVTSHEISPEWHVKMQAAFQKYTDNAVSKTVNFENSATIEDVEKAYMLAYDLGCKGITIYRDGSRDNQVLNIGKVKEEAPVEVPVPVPAKPKERPAILIGKTTEITTGCGKMYVTINQDQEGNVFEVFTSIGKAGGCAQSQSEAIGRLISLNLRSGVEPEFIIKQLKGISCHMPYGFGSQRVLSCADAVGKALDEAIKNPLNTQVIRNDSITVDTLLADMDKKAGNKVVSNGACPDCGAPVEYIEGCLTCQSCGYSKCS